MYKRQLLGFIDAMFSIFEDLIDTMRLRSQVSDGIPSMPLYVDTSLAEKETVFMFLLSNLYFK